MPTYTQLAADPLNGADINPLDPTKWQLTGVGGEALQIKNHFVCATSNQVGCDGLYYSIIFAPDQWASFTVHAIDNAASTNNSCGIYIRDMQEDTTYRVMAIVQGPLGASARIGLFSSQGAGGVYLSQITTPIVSGDEVRIEGLGSAISVKVNGVVVTTGIQPAQFTPPSNAVIWPGIDAESYVTPATDAQFTNFKAGNIISTPPPSLYYSVPDCRVAPAGPNASRNVNSTLIYDVQTSDNAAIPPVDSRTAGAPVDSRVVPNIPQNSRTPGTYGPGE